jgi:DNA recombination protein Rad52
MPFSDTQTKLLSSKLNEKAIKTRHQEGKVLSYIEGWHAIAEANRIFGFDGWDRETVLTECVWQDAKREPKACAYVARVRIRVRAGEWMVCREGSGTGHGRGATLGEAHESALKEAETDAMKRALATFGNLFGLALYDREQNGVRRRTTARAAPVSLTLLSDTGALVSRHALPEEFCGAFRELIERTAVLEELKAIWARNATTVGHLRRGWPDLKTVNGTHYGEVLEKLFEQQAERLAQRRESKHAETSASPIIDKSALTLATPKRLRDADHRKYVASLPCLVCGRSPSQAHHLRFAQPRALGSKVSDEWIVPLCAIHHRALHDYGPEETWWEQAGINALAHAQRLWQQNHIDAKSEAATLLPAPELTHGDVT